MANRGGINSTSGDYSMKNMGSMNQSGLVDPNNNLMGGSKTLQESSDSESESSNSSVGSQKEKLANSLN